MSAKFFSGNSFTSFNRLIKSILDRLVAAIALLFISPLLLIVASAVYLRMGRPILFSQYRSGKEGKIFTVYKFRSMTDARDSSGRSLPDEQRITALGQFLRRFKVDEILQLWNILKGEMSFVGPRPTLPEQVQNYNDLQKCRLLVLPGLTGWAQINGNIQLTWDERICLDLWYLNHWSLWLDFTIILKTFAVVLWGERRREEALQEAVNICKSFSSDLLKVHVLHSKP